jgi:hypothetical protein
VDHKNLSSSKGNAEFSLKESTKLFQSSIFYNLSTSKEKVLSQAVSSMDVLPDKAYLNTSELGDLLQDFEFPDLIASEFDFKQVTATPNFSSLNASVPEVRIF